MADKISWIDAFGTEIPLTDNYKVLSGMQGRFMPPLEMVEEEVPLQAGSRLRTIKVLPRDIDIPLYILADSEKDLRLKMRSFLRVFNPLNGNGTIKVTAPDGTIREIACRYISGLEGKEDRDSKGVYWQIVLLVFRAFDPFWYESGTIVKTFKMAESQATFFPMFPLRLTSSTVFADATVENTGDVETWPEWIITGPGENLTIRNMTTGEVVQLDHIDAKLGAGEILTINTKPFAKTIEKNNGMNIFHTLTDESSLWSLVEGYNNIRIEMANATSESSIQLTYRHRYWGP